MSKDRLNSIARNSVYANGASADSVRYLFEVFSRFLKDGTVLELGPAEGLMTDLLVAHGRDLTVVEGARSFVEAIKKRYPNISCHHSLFEDFQSERRFDNILLGHVLEHVEDPVRVLRRFSAFLKDEGLIMSAVPNSRSIHRQAAVLLRLLSYEEEFSDLDRKHGHRRIYNPETFRRDFLQAGLRIRFFGGYWLKPLSNEQLAQSWTAEMLHAFMQLGERYPDISAVMYIVASKS